MNRFQAVLYGILCAVPFFVVNAIVATRPEPFYSELARLGIIPDNLLFLLALLALGLAGASIAARPIFQDKMRSAYIVNGVVALMLVVFFLIVGSALFGELYRCEIQLIENCD